MFTRERINEKVEEIGRSWKKDLIDPFKRRFFYPD